MRVCGVALLLFAAACQQNSAQVAFDGAEATEAAGQVAHGERLTHVLGCRGCHGSQLQGHRFYERWARNLTQYVPKHDDTELIEVLRVGGEPGEELWGMPSEIFQHLSDPDMAALLAYLRTLKPAGSPDQPPLPWNAEGREAIRKGELKPAATFVRERKNVTPLDVGRSHALGRYITMVTCAECHGPRLEGHRDFTPDLLVAGGYTRKEFEALITQGILPSGRKFKHELMAEVAKERFAHLTPHERDALYAYLKARAEQPK
jgi:mono/diheme cytochrome c family protein